MNYKYPLSFLFVLLLTAPLFSEKKVEFIANYPVDVQSLSATLHKHHLPVTVVPSDLSNYGERLKNYKKGWRKYLSKLPYSITVGEDVAKIVFWNITSSYRRDLNLSRLPKDKLVLFMWEPPTVLKKMYAKKVADCFSKVYTWDDDLVDGKTYFKFYYPVLRPMKEDIPSFEEKKLCTLVATNIDSDAPHELYSERKKAIAFFESKNETGFEFYGKGWSPTEHPSYRGPTQDKIQTIQQYRFSICYENTQEIKGYITEKIFDCFAAGNVPIYWGASNIECYIPKECFIDKRNFANLEDLYNFLKKMGKEDYEKYLKNIRSYLSSDRAKLYSQENFDKIFVESIAN